MKKLLKALLAIVVILIAVVLAHPLWIGPVVRTVVTSVVPKILGVPAQLDEFSLNAYTGRLVIEGFSLDNPPACGQEKFVKVGRLCVDVDPFTVCSDPIVIEEISVSNLYVSLVTDEKSVYNYEIVSGGPKDAPTPAEAKPAKAAAEPKAESKPAPKVIIDLIDVRSALVQWRKIPLPLPSFRMTGIGRSAGGVDFEVAWQEFEKQFIESLGPLAKGLQDSLAGAQKVMDEGIRKLDEATTKLNETATKLNETTKKSLDGATKALDGVTKPIGGASKVLGGATKSVTDLTSKSVSGATESVSDVTKSVTEGSTKALESTTKALGDGVKSLKSFFK